MYRLMKVLAFLVLITHSIQAQQLPAQNNPQLQRDRAAVLWGSKENFDIQKLAANLADANEQENFDVLHYELNLEIYPGSQMIVGIVQITGKSTIDGLLIMAIDLYDNMIVSTVKRNGKQLSFTQNNNRIYITLDKSFDKDQEFTIAISYEGHPVETGLSAFTFRTHMNQPIISSLSEPYYARTWWPCKDVPSDKATAEINVIVPNTLIVASNGSLVDVIDRDNNRREYKWKETYPISTYLISVAITNYSVFSDYYLSASGDSMEVMYYVYPEHLDMASVDFDVTVDMIQFFSSIFGEYPFSSEKYGLAEFPFGGAMEHQTMTSYGSGLITGNHRFDFVNAHELAHQWWGDLVTVKDWPDIWLNEGFASYSEALWIEHLDGEQAYQTYMKGMDRSSFPGSVYDPGYLFNVTVYDKGAWVLHMLRHVIGDQAFFNILPRYASEFAYANASTEDFQRICEREYGKDLDWFFSQWIYETGRPNYEYAWDYYKSGQYYIAYLHIEQNPSEVTNLPEPANDKIFTMPLDVSLSFAYQADLTFVVSDSSQNQDFRFILQHEPSSLQIDKDNWVLKHLTELPLDVPATAGDLNNSGNVTFEDLIRLVDIILGRNATPSLQELAVSDVNGDNSINAVDLTAVIYSLLGI